ncbi:MAG: hypothetical protein C4547_14560 [Phycisphaerales bacterium]|nr:MAG: hypothetical protein C4547_14560 [Phycisphaerales bacterium]
MSEQDDRAERQEAIDTLSTYHRKMDELEALLSRPYHHLGNAERVEVRESYKWLKNDLKAERHRLERAEACGQITHVEKAFVLPALSGSLTHLKPATNSNPANSRWFEAVYGAHVDISFALAGLRRQQTNQPDG